VPPSTDYKTSEVTFFLGSVASFSDVLDAAKGVDLIYHVASLIELSPNGTKVLYETNVRGTQNIVDACIQLGITRLVYTSTIDVISDKGALVGEQIIKSNRRAPSHAYGKTKTMAERIVIEANGRKTDHNTTLFTLALRPVHIYGPGDKLALAAVQVGKTGFVPIWGNGLTYCIYIDNAAYGHLLAGEALLSPEKCSTVAGNVYYLKDDYLTSFHNSLFEFAKMKYPQVIQIRIPLWFISLIGMLFTFFYSIIYFLGFHPEYVFSYWHVVLMSRTLKMSDLRSREDFGYFQKVSNAEGMRETEKWIQGLQ
jgi:sterol-4alpha-carboxylate 3-dehydrogenase (decarboxylating)